MFLLIFSTLLLLVGPLYSANDSASACPPDPACVATCHSRYGTGSALRITYASEIQSCPGGADAYGALQGCYLPLQDEVNACVQPCGMDELCIDRCISERNRKEKRCVEAFAGFCLSYCSSSCPALSTCVPSNGTNQSGIGRPNETNRTIETIPRNDTNAGNDSLIVTHPNETTTMTKKKNCSVSIIREYDGVSADGVSEITFTMAVEGDVASATIDIIPIDGPLKGTITHPTPTSVTFKPDEADASRNYLTPQKARAVAQCTTKDRYLQGSRFVFEDFTVEQPPLFFVHGLKSDAQASFGVFEKRAGGEGWQYDDIDYGGRQDNVISAHELSEKLQLFIINIHNGKYYHGRRISARKADIISHSMGGLVTRYYINNFYEGDIRKFVMMGTPNHGSWDAYLKDVPILGWLFMSGDAVDQLKPNSQFIAGLNAVGNNPEIDYHTVAGTGWLTDTAFMETTFEGDAIVLVASVRLPGVPLYCTYDAHAGILYWAGMMSPTAFVNNGGGWASSQGGTLTTSNAAYGIVKSAILTGHATTVAPCPTSPMPADAGPPSDDAFNAQSYPFVPMRNTRNGPSPSGSHGISGVRGIVYSPVVLHAYDEQGRHVGPNAQGVPENQIGAGVYYANISEFGHQMITIYGQRNITFDLAGAENGTYRFALLKLNAGGEPQFVEYKDRPISKGQLNQIDSSAQRPELRVAEPRKAAGLPGAGIPPVCPIALALIVLAMVAGRR